MLLRGLLLAVWSFLCPGVWQAVGGRRVAALVWAGVTFAVMLALPWTIWAIYPMVLIRVVALIEGIARQRRSAAAESWWRAHAIAATCTGAVGHAFARLFVEAFTIPAASMVPALEIDDLIMTESLTLQWRAPERGEIVVFRQPCNPEVEYVKRVVAIGNDTVEIRCNVLYVNGAAVPSGLVDGEHCEYRDRAEVMDGEASPWTTRSCSRYREVLDGHSYDVFHDPERPARDAAAKSGRVQGDAKDFPQLGGELMNCEDAAGHFGEPVKDQPPGKLVVTKPDAADPCELQLHFVVPPDSLFMLGDNRSNSNDSRYWGVVPVDHVKRRAFGRWHPLSRFGTL